MSLNIMHVDMDAFFAAVEQNDRPELKGKPVIVGGSLDKRGVVSTASYEARIYGVHSAMPIAEARRLCPDGIFLPGRYERYSEISEKIFNIFLKYTPLVERVSIDEAFLDLTGCHRLFGSSIEIGKKIKEDIYNELGLTASVGLATNKFLAKLASDMDKPDGFFIIEEDRVDKILEPLPVKKIWGVGKKAEEALKKRGIFTIGDLKKLSLNDLELLFGKPGVQLYYLSRGIDNRRVEVETEVKSVSHEETFSEDISDHNQILASLMGMSAKVSRRLRKQGFEGNTIFIKIRYSDFSTYTRRITINVPTDSTDKIYSTGCQLLMRENLLRKPVRLLGIGVSSLSRTSTRQLSLFSDNEKEEKLKKTIDILKDKYGENSIRRARTLD